MAGQVLEQGPGVALLRRQGLLCRSGLTAKLLAKGLGGIGAEQHRSER